jgi:hypothetical protein
MRTYARDFRFVFFTLGAAFAFCTSAPNTYAMLAAFHDGAHVFPSAGAILTLCGVLLLEVGAIGAMIAGMWWLCYGFLGMTFAANWIIGADVLAQADLAQNPTFAALRDGWAGGLLPFVYAALVPVFLAVFLHNAVARAHDLSADAQPDAHPEIAQMRTEVRDALAQIAQAVRPQLTADQVRMIVGDVVGETRARELPAPTPQRAAPAGPVCPNCAAPVNPRTFQRVKERGYCGKCRGG